MDKQMILMGKILGEVYRLQKNLSPNHCKVGDGTIYGLLNGFEDTINDELTHIGFISETQMKVVHDVLAPYFRNDRELKGFYDIEYLLQENGVSRTDFIKIATKLTLENRYTELFKKFNTDSSPAECLTFNIYTGL
jgi:hypothetical protein